MKTPNYQTLRRAVFSVYILLTVLFCLLLFQMGRMEMARAKDYAERERGYVESLNKCRERLNALSSGAMRLAGAREDGLDEAMRVESMAREFRASVSKLKAVSLKRGDAAALRMEALQEAARLAHSISFAAIADAGCSEPERGILLHEDFDTLDKALEVASGSLQEFLKSETNHVENWQSQSLYFFGRLQYLVVVFFIAATLFSVAASFLFSRILKSSLRRLSEGTREISAGNLKHRFADIQADEIGQVMHDFNLMARKLESQSKALTQANIGLKAQAEKLIEAHQHKDRFLANMSHELRTPLNSVIGFAELMTQRSDSMPPEKVKSGAQRILSAAEHLLELISGLLEVAKFDAGVLKPVFSDFDLSFCVEETCSMLRPLAEKKGLSLKVEPAAPLHIQADRRMVRQALINLVGNAVKFTSEGGVVARVRAAPDGFAAMEVEDSGIGIPESEQANLFKDFHRVETGLTINYEGVGIGLALSRRLVDLHGGRIIFQSTLGKGSVFTVLLPLRPDKHECKE